MRPILTCKMNEMKKDHSEKGSEKTSKPTWPKAKILKYYAEITDMRTNLAQIMHSVCFIVLGMKLVSMPGQVHIITRYEKRLGMCVL